MHRKHIQTTSSTPSRYHQQPATHNITHQRHHKRHNRPDQPSGAHVTARTGYRDQHSRHESPISSSLRRTPCPRENITTTSRAIAAIASPTTTHNTWQQHHKHQPQHEHNRYMWRPCGLHVQAWRNHLATHCNEPHCTTYASSATHHGDTPRRHTLTTTITGHISDNRRQCCRHCLTETSRINGVLPIAIVIVADVVVAVVVVACAIAAEAGSLPPLSCHCCRPNRPC
jgi:hypothetical protein